MPLKDKDVNRVRAIRMRDGKLTLPDERFLFGCWKHHHSREALDTLIEKLIPVFYETIHAAMRARGIPTDAAGDLLSEAICGRPSLKDGGRAVARGILGAIQTYDSEKGARIGTYVRKWVRGAVTDWKEAEDRAKAGHVSHLDDGTPYLDVLASPPAGNNHSLLDAIEDCLSRMSHRDMAVLQAVIVDEKTKVETSAGLGVSRHILDGHLTTAVDRLRAEVAPAESDDTPLKRSRWWKKYKSFDGLHRRNCERVYNKPVHDELPFRDVTYPHRNISPAEYRPQPTLKVEWEVPPEVEHGAPSKLTMSLPTRRECAPKGFTDLGDGIFIRRAPTTARCRLEPVRGHTPAAEGDCLYTRLSRAARPWEVIADDAARTDPWEEIRRQRCGYAPAEELPLAA